MTAYVVAGEQFAQNAAVGQTADAVALLGELGHLEAANPRALVPIAHIDLGPRGQGCAQVRIRCCPPAIAHRPIVLRRAWGR